MAEGGSQLNGGLSRTAWLCSCLPGKARGPLEPCCGINTTGHLMCPNFLVPPQLSWLSVAQALHPSHLVCPAARHSQLCTSPCAALQQDCYAEVLSAPTLGPA